MTIPRFYRNSASGKRGQMTLNFYQWESLEIGQEFLSACKEASFTVPQTECSWSLKYTLHSSFTCHVKKKCFPDLPNPRVNKRGQVVYYWYNLTTPKFFKHFLSHKSSEQFILLLHIIKLQRCLSDHICNRAPPTLCAVQRSCQGEKFAHLFHMVRHVFS